MIALLGPSYNAYRAIHDILGTGIPKFEDEFPVKQGCVSRSELVHSRRDYI